MRIFSATACVLLLASVVRAQLGPRLAAVPDVMTVAALQVPALLTPALASPAFAAAPSLFLAAPALGPVFAPALDAAPALAAETLAAAASTPEKGKTPSGDHAAAALSEFSRLVADLMSGKKAQAAAAAAGLNELKDAHLNVSPEPKSVKILDLKPMQIPAGMYEVQDKAQSLRGMKAKDSDKWLRDKSVPYVEDYKGRKRPVDHHHEARAAWEADLSEAYAHRYLDDQLHDSIKALPRDAFYAVTHAMGLFYDRDQFGSGPHDPNHLPEDVRGMADDPFRSIAWQVRKRGGYDKSGLPFAEFHWAQFFRERVQTYPTRADFEKSVLEAMRIVHDPAAKGLPGYRPK
jgi:hypothetical protein